MSVLTEEALKIADALHEYNMDGLPVYVVGQAVDMIRKLVAHIEELENPIMQAIAQAFDEPKDNK